MLGDGDFPAGLAHGPDHAVDGRDLLPGQIHGHGNGRLGFGHGLDALAREALDAGDADGVEIARERTVEGTRRFARRQERRFRQDARVQWMPAGTSADTLLDLLQGTAT